MSAPHESSPRANPSRGANWLRSFLRNLPHHRSYLVVKTLDAIYRIGRWVVGGVILGGFVVGAIVDFFESGKFDFKDVPHWPIVRTALANPWLSIAVVVLLVVLFVLGAIAHRVPYLKLGRIGHPKRFQAACASVVNDTIQDIPKYDASLYVAREGVDQEFAEFQRSPFPCLLVLGAAGMGKTNLLCEMARERATRAPTLLLPGTTYMEGPLGFWKVIADELSARTNHPVDHTRIVELLDDSLRIWDTELVIFIDGINENAQIDRLKTALARAAQEARGTAIRICLSCRDVDWHAFEQERGLIAQLYQPEETSAGASQGVTIGEFTDSEFDQAWTKYSRHFRLEGDLSDRLTQVCHHPLMLSFLCLAFKGRAVPPGVHRKEIFDEYWKEKLTNRYGRSTELALLHLVGRMYERRYVQIRELDAVEVIGPEEEYHRLLDEAVIIYAHTDRAGEPQVRFTYDAFFEYALARYLRDDKWRWSSSDAPDVPRDLHTLLEEDNQYRFVQGSLQYLLLYLADSKRRDEHAPSDRQTACRFLLELAGRPDTRWMFFFCDFATKADDPSLTVQLVPTLEQFATDGDTFVRWSSGIALGMLAGDMSPSGEQLRMLADERLRAMERSTDWKERETAAVALGQLYRDFAPLRERLEYLADDINWRVRRQVGNTLDDLCRLAPNASFQLLRAWAGSDRWRLRRAVVQARIGLLKNRDLALDLLPKLANDGVEEIRWRTVSDLANLVKLSAETSYSARALPLPLLLTLSRDETSIWVRRHVAFWIPDLYQAVGSACNEIIEQLLRDEHPHVLWETARALGSFKDKQRVETWLMALRSNPDEQVRFAVRYSLAALSASERALVPLLESPDEDVRLRAQAEQLARSSRVPDKPTKVDILNAAKPDRFEFIQEVLKSGTTTKSPAEVRGLYNLLRTDEDEGIRWAAATLLGSVEAFTASEKDTILQDFTRDPHYWTRREGLSSLAQMIQDDGFRPSPALAERVVACGADEESAEVRREALLCLLAFKGKVGEFAADFPTNAIDQALNNLLNDEDRQVRELAEAALAPARIEPETGC